MYYLFNTVMGKEMKHDALQQFYTNLRLGINVIISLTLHFHNSEKLVLLGNYADFDVYFQNVCEAETEKKY